MVTCRECGRKDVSLYPYRDFHGNGICVVCDQCGVEVNRLLNRVKELYGGVCGASPKGSPFITSLKQLRKEAARTTRLK